ncbi:uncharacterized protein LOC109405681 [Aedes albopictus]|uniref:Uncharacterized protein n=1 Tax=Aedes albopictus TaxID=7160 RepID=A0ABM1YAV3_AEDAL
MNYSVLGENETFVVLRSTTTGDEDHGYNPDQQHSADEHSSTIGLLVLGLIMMMLVDQIFLPVSLNSTGIATLFSAGTFLDATTFHILPELTHNTGRGGHRTGSHSRVEATLQNTGLALLISKVPLPMFWIILTTPSESGHRAADELNPNIAQLVKPVLFCRRKRNRLIN